MQNFKHGSPFQPSELLVHRENTAMCPATPTKWIYCSERITSRAIIRTHWGLAVAREFFTTELQKALQFCKLDPTRYKSHSFTGCFLWLLYSTLHSTLLDSTFLYATLLYSTLLYATLRYSTLLYSTPLHSTLLYATLLYSSLLYSILLYSTLLYSTLPYSTISLRLH